MTLPASRNTTYAAGSQVKSADLNALQDMIIALFGTKSITPSMGFPDEALNPAERRAYGYIGSKLAHVSHWFTPIEFPVGAILTRLNVSVLEADAGGETVTLQLWQVGAGAPTQIGDTIVSGTTGGIVLHYWDDTTNDSVGEIPYTFIENARLYLRTEFAVTTADGEAQVQLIVATRSA